MDPITTRDQLVDALMDAGDVEHQLMVQYLYAGFSLRRDPEPGKCTAAQYEHVRRWSSTLFMIARQEMEHLSFVNEMLTAIGAPPHFCRENIGKDGLQSPYFSAETLAREAGAGDPQPISLPYAFERFSAPTIARFVCGESPPYADLPEGVDPYWCFDCGDRAGGEAGDLTMAPETEPPLLAARLHDRKEIAAGNVQELYEAIAEAFRTLEGIFVDDPAEVEVPVEYNVFVFPVTDKATAVAAVDLILKQGEGLGDPWNLDSHFRRFMEILGELLDLQQADPSFDPAYRLLRNPVAADIENDFTRGVFEAANDSYVVLLLMLAGLYARAVPASQDRYPHFATALSQMAFAPAMTMVVRPLNEVLVQLPIGASGWSVGSNYFIPPEDQALLSNPLDAKLGDITTMLDRWQALTARVEGLVAAAPDEATAASLEYVRQTCHRIQLNLRHIYQAGAYPKFVPS